MVLNYQERTTMRKVKLRDKQTCKLSGMDRAGCAIIAALTLFSIARGKAYNADLEEQSEGLILRSYIATY